ncbi:protein claret segregational-like [Temnothorax nylanderi]|uniref:protein claret segregational-like n=1 Tax=Temnothorax nylanderi TaxID=102681 RepID=UPI003A87FBF0
MSEEADKIVTLRGIFQRITNYVIKKGEEIKIKLQQRRQLNDPEILKLFLEEQQVKSLNKQIEAVKERMKENSAKHEETIEKYETILRSLKTEYNVLVTKYKEITKNVQVMSRVRPRTADEIIRTKPLGDIKITDYEIKIKAEDTIKYNKFTFNKIFTPEASQEEVFKELSFLVQLALEGYINVCVFAYGQAGSGKTYTMEGKYDSEGMLPRTVRYILDRKKELKLSGWDYRVEASFLEIYNERIIDLLNLNFQPNNKKHKIRIFDSSDQDAYVSNLQIKKIQSPEEFNEYLRIARRNLITSSKSHLVARIRLIGTHSVKQEVLVGNLNFVDLAGSIKIKAEDKLTKVEMTEAININKSLASLSNVILALLKKQKHIPYKNSKLTHLLMPTLRRDSKILMVLNISPLCESYNETLKSLKFVSNAINC